MIKILHSGDWHMDSPVVGLGASQREQLRRNLLEVPGKLAALCHRVQADIVLLTGDLFDGAYTQSGYRAVFDALKEMAVPVFISPGNHDFVSPESPWMRELWPENVHIFKKNQIESVWIPQLNCRVYGAGFTEMDCPALLEGFQATEGEVALGCFHGDPTLAGSPYNPISRQQVAASGLDYLALGHIHKADAFRANKTLCAWSGCPMGTGYDEEGIKGAWVVTVEEEAAAEFVTLNFPRFYDVTVSADSDLSEVLPAVSNDDFYRITFAGEGEKPDLEALKTRYRAFPNLELRDKTVPPVDLWTGAGEDSFEGLYFGMLKQQLEMASEEEKEKILLAAKISRQILAGEEVALP